MKNYMCGKEVNLLNYLLSSYLLEIFNYDELNVIGNFLQLLGQSLITLSAQNEYCDTNNKENK